MKKILLALICTMVAFPVIAKDKNKGFIFIPENVVIETVKDVKNKSDDTLVVMQGKIVKALGDDKYAFTDSGVLLIEVGLIAS